MNNNKKDLNLWELLDAMDNPELPDEDPVSLVFFLNLSGDEIEQAYQQDLDEIVTLQNLKQFHNELISVLERLYFERDIEEVRDDLNDFVKEQMDHKVSVISEGEIVIDDVPKDDQEDIFRNIWSNLIYHWCYFNSDWTGKIGKCAFSECGKWFVKNRRFQKYHSKKCADKAVYLRQKRRKAKKP